MGKMGELNTVMWALFALMTMFYLGPGDQNTFNWLFELAGLS
jgi:hypothetical protein